MSSPKHNCFGSLLILRFVPITGRVIFTTYNAHHVTLIFSGLSKYNEMTLVLFWSRRHTRTCLNLQRASSHLAAQTPTELLHQSLVIFQLKTRFSIFPFFTWLHLQLRLPAVSSPALFFGTWCLTGEDEFYGDATLSVITIQNVVAKEANGWRLCSDRRTLLVLLKVRFLSIPSNPSKLIQMFHSLEHQCLFIFRFFDFFFLNKKQKIPLLIILSSYGTLLQNNFKYDLYL